MSRITGLKNKIDALRAQIIALKMTPNNQYLASLNHKINDLTDKLAVANEEIEHRFSSDYVKTLDDYILSLKKEVAGKQITIDAIEFDMDRAEKRLTGADEIIIKLGKEIELLNQKVDCKEEDINILLYQLDKANKNFKCANENLIKINESVQSLEAKKIKNRLKKLLSRMEAKHEA